MPHPFNPINLLTLGQLLHPQDLKVIYFLHFFFHLWGWWLRPNIMRSRKWLLSHWSILIRIICSLISWVENSHRLPDFCRFYSFNIVNLVSIFFLHKLCRLFFYSYIFITFEKAWVLVHWLCKFSLPNFSLAYTFTPPVIYWKDSCVNCHFVSSILLVFQHEQLLCVFSQHLSFCLHVCFDCSMNVCGFCFTCFWVFLFSTEF